MKFIVDEMPKQDECIFSEWKPYPPIIEKSGEWYCKNDKKICHMEPHECRWLKEQKDEGKIF